MPIEGNPHSCIVLIGSNFVILMSKTKRRTNYASPHSPNFVCFNEKNNTHIIKANKVIIIMWF